MRSCCCRLSSRRFCATLFFSLLLVVSADRRAMAPVDALTQIYEINEKQYANRNLIYGDVGECALSILKFPIFAG